MRSGRWLMIVVVVGIIFAGTNVLADVSLSLEVPTAPDQAVNVTMQNNALIPHFNYTGGVRAGSYVLSINSVTTPAYCAEFQLAGSGLLAYQKLALADTPQNREIAWIVENYSPSLNPGNYARNVNAQVAIWEVLGTLPGNSFSVTDWAGPGAYGSKAGADGIYTAAVGANPGAAVLSGVALYHSDNYQDYIAPVPEPSVLLFLGMSLVGACVAGRRFKKI